LKAIILAGGLGTRISEETAEKPKPMVRIGDQPIIWHLMSIFAMQGVNDFIIATGYKGEVIQTWVDSLETSWKIEAIDTGLDTQTGGRIQKCMRLVPGERVIATYGDGLGNINLSQLINFHEKQGLLGTVTAVRPPARFGVLESSNGAVTHFGEKNQTDSGWINGGFFVLEPDVVDLVHGEGEPFETGAIPRLVATQQLAAFHHEGFWQPMDTLREKEDLEKLASLGNPPWMKIEGIR
jgi:glucose-1-phosphate cytidylyltransferase